LTARLAAALLCLAGLAGPAAAEASRWDDYQLIMWQDQGVAGMAGLARLGFSGVKLRGTGGQIDPASVAARRQAGLPWFVENIATDFYAPYHRYTEGKPVTWLFDAARARRRQAPEDRSVFVRAPGLSDPAWFAAIRARLADVVRRQAPDRPLFYNLGDETGIGDLSANWDFDVSPASLKAMRVWLQTQYPDLGALNRQWGSRFESWEEVVPDLTDDAMRRTDDNFSAWADFKAWMDVAFAAAVRVGTDAVHRADPAALSAIEGAQVPGWGGYDYGRLAQAVDAMEIYDSGNSLEIAHGLNPALIPLHTMFETGLRADHAAWRDLLRGGRGLIVWDELNDTVRPDGEPGPRGRALAALVAGLRVVAPALIASRPAASPVAILYSQASFRTRWMLDQRPRGAAWSDRDAERELDDNAWRAGRRQMVDRLAQIGMQPRWLSSETLEGGALQDGAIKVLMLPHAIALSAAEVEEVKRFAARGGTVLTDTEPGVFDQHSRRRAGSPLAGVAQMPQVVRPDAEPSSAAGLTAFADVLAKAGAAPDWVMTGPDGLRASNVDAHVFRNGGVLILALQAMAPWGAPGQLGVQLPAPGFIYDMRRAGAPRQADRLDIGLDPIEPTILAVSAVPLPGPVLSGPDRAQPGTQVTWHVGLDGPTPAETHAMRVDLLDPAGALVRPLSGVLRVGRDGADWTMMLPESVMAGRWTLRVADSMAARAAERTLLVEGH
jgi:hypothetical protein